MNRLSRLLENPVFVKEMRVGFREKKVFFALTAWVIIVALFASISAAGALGDNVAISELPERGQYLFEMLFWVQLVLLLMLAPSLTTSAVSGERERQSLDMLLTTHLAPAELIFGKFGFPELGIRGAALGTVIATACSLLIYAAFYFNRIHRERFHVAEAFHYDRGILQRYVRLGLPSGFETFVGAAAFNFFLLLFQSYGITEGAAMAIVFNWDMLNYVPLIGLNIAVTSMIGRYVGSGDMTRANQVIAAGFTVALGFSVLLALFFVLFRYELMMVFATPEQDFTAIVALGASMMLGMATYVVADAVILVCSGVLRGAGDTRWLMNTSMTLHVLMLLGQYVMIKHLGVGPLVSWWGFVAMLLALALVYLLRLRGTTWRRPSRLARVMAE